MAAAAIHPNGISLAGKAAPGTCCGLPPKSSPEAESVGESPTGGSCTVTVDAGLFAVAGGRWSRAGWSTVGGVALDGAALVPEVESRAGPDGVALGGLRVVPDGSVLGRRGDGAAVFVVGLCCGSAWRVTVPGKLKFSSSRGPTGSALLVWVVLGVCAGGTSWASAATGPSARPVPKTAIAKRNFAVIQLTLIAGESRFIEERVSPHAGQSRRLQAQAFSTALKPAPQRASTRTNSLSSIPSIRSALSPVMATPSRGSASTPLTRIFPLETR